MNESLTDEQREDLRKVVAYAVYVQYGELAKKSRVKGMTNVIAMHIEDFYLNGKVKKTT